MDVTVRVFVENLWTFFSEKKNLCIKNKDNSVLGDKNLLLSDSSQNSFQPQHSSLLRFGHIRGWLEDQDEVESENCLLRRSAARIIHQFMKIELHIPDLDDISSADVLKDLYTCRICVNHVAQVYLRNLLPAEEILQDDHAVLIFNMLKPVSYDEMTDIFNNLSNLCLQNDYR